MTTTRDPRTDPRYGDEIRFKDGTTATVLLCRPNAVTHRLSFENRIITSTLVGWREFASTAEVIRGD